METLRTFTINKQDGIRSNSLSPEDNVLFKTYSDRYLFASDLESLVKAQFRNFTRTKVQALCTYKGKDGIKRFWQYVTGIKRSHSKLNVVLLPDGSRTNCPMRIAQELESHLCSF